MRVLFCLFIILSISCSDNDSNPSDNCIPGLVDESIFNSSENFGVVLSDITLDGNCLIVELGISGCDDNHTIEMVTDGAIAESEPPQITFDFYDKNPQACQAFFMVEMSYDLDPIKNLYDDEIIITFRNSEKVIKYSK